MDKLPRIVNDPGKIDVGLRPKNIKKDKNKIIYWIKHFKTIKIRKNNIFRINRFKQTGILIYHSISFKIQKFRYFLIF